METEVIEFKPLPGAQEQFLGSPADICIFGGARGPGKTFCLALEPLRHVEKPLFRSVIFRRTFSEVYQEGGPWDTTIKIYPYAGAQSSGDTWTFPSGATVGFGHMKDPNDWQNWLGSQVPLIGFDQLEMFTETQFFSMLACNRDPNGIVTPYVRATCNPDPDSWLARFISWWWDKDTGYPIMERSGVIRWFIRSGNNIIWASNRDELTRNYPGLFPKSVTFIPAFVTDNTVLMANDPSYLGNLQAQDEVLRERWIKGNWKIRPTAGMYLPRDRFRVIKAAPMHRLRRFIRFWDLAATREEEGVDPDWTVGALLTLLDGEWYLLDVRRLRGNPKQVEDEIKRVAASDPRGTSIRMEREGGASGKSLIDLYARNMLVGYDFTKAEPIRRVRTKEKEMLWVQPFSSAVLNGHFYIVEATWNNEFLDECDAFPTGPHDDQVISVASAMAQLAGPAVGAYERVPIALRESNRLQNTSRRDESLM